MHQGCHDPNANPNPNLPTLTLILNLTLTLTLTPTLTLNGFKVGSVDQTAAAVLSTVNGRLQRVETFFEELKGYKWTQLGP